MRLLIDDRLDLSRLDELLAQASEQRRRQALRYRRPADRLASLAAFKLLREALRQEYGIDEAPTLLYDERGKPRIDGRPDIHISLSHCAAAVACAVANRPVGIDIECLELLDDDTIAATMNEAEQRIITEARNPVEAFLRLWTRKESLLKLTGEGLRNDMRHVLSDAQARDVEFRTTASRRYVYSLCLMKNFS